LLGAIWHFRGHAALLVAFDPIGNDVSKWVYALTGEAPSGVQVVHLPDRASIGDGGYLATVNGLDVHVLPDMPGDRAILFSKAALRAIEYRSVDPARRIAEVEFVQGVDPRRSELRVRFGQEVEWDDSPVIEFELRNGRAIEGQDESVGDAGG
jgi:hypothetical protein